jgi:hypothetical protein
MVHGTTTVMGAVIAPLLIAAMPGRVPIIFPAMLAAVYVPLGGLLVYLGIAAVARRPRLTRVAGSVLLLLSFAWPAVMIWYGPAITGRFWIQGCNAFFGSILSAALLCVRIPKRQHS